LQRTSGGYSPRALSTERLPLQYGVVEWDAERISKPFYDPKWDI
jgi:hypothetical protein